MLRRREPRSMAMGREFLRTRPARQAAFVDPFLRRLGRPLHEFGRRREIERRHRERAQCRHEMHLDVAGNDFQLVHELPGDQQRDRVQRLGDGALRRPLSAQA